MLHLTAAARHILQRDPGRAEQALLQAEQLGRQSLADVRRTVGLLRTAADGDVPSPASWAPLPSATCIRGLVEEYAGAGMNVQLAIVGDVCQLPPAAGLALYRIAQEGLANVARHAAGATAQIELVVDDQQDAVHLRVRDSGGIAVVRQPGTGESGG
jgi:signal transduction histidine kinase